MRRGNLNSEFKSTEIDIDRSREIKMEKIFTSDFILSFICVAALQETVKHG